MPREIVPPPNGAFGSTRANTPSELNYGSGSPESIYLGFATPTPSLYVDVDAPALYVKTSGNGTRTGWSEISGGGGGGGTTLRYLEWTLDADLEQSVDFPAGTIVTLGFVAVHIGFDGDAFPALDLGVGDDPTCWLSGGQIDTGGVVHTATDLNGGSDAEGFSIGFPYSSDGLTQFPDGGTIIGTLTPAGSTVGLVRFYFQSFIPVPA